MSSTNPIIPFEYRLWTLYIEPLSALGGTILGLTDPIGLSRVFIPSTISPSSPSPSLFPELAYSATTSSPSLPPLTQTYLTQSLSLYTLFVILEGVLLRWATYTPLLSSSPEARMQIWTIIMVGMVGSDAFYLLSSWQMYTTVGAVDVFWLPWRWGSNEWMNLSLSWVALFHRVAFLAGFGLGGKGKGKGKERAGKGQ